MKKIYLAHGLASKQRYREWELNFEKKHNISLINPFYDVERHDNDSPSIIVERDVDLIKNSDGLLIIVDENCRVGAFQEMIYAKFLNKPVYVISINGKYKKHPWIIYHSNKIFDSLEEFDEFITSSITF